MHNFHLYALMYAIAAFSNLFKLANFPKLQLDQVF